MICPHCTQWNPAGRRRCVFCLNELENGSDRTSLGPSGETSRPTITGLAPAPYLREPGSPAELARTMRVAAKVVGAIAFGLGLLYVTCTGC